MEPMEKTEMAAFVAMVIVALAIVGLFCWGFVEVILWLTSK